MKIPDQNTTLQIAPRLEHIYSELLECKTDFERLRIRDEAKAVAAAAAILKRKDIQVPYAILIQEAEREIAKANPPAPLGRGKVVMRNHDFSNDVLRHVRSVHSNISDDEWEERKAQALAQEEVLTRASLRQEVYPHVSNNSGENEWYTPPDIIERARLVLGTIDLDPASSDAAQETVKAAHYFTRETDGLSQEWFGQVWMNPPYAQPLIQQFVDKLLASPDVTGYLVLVNNATETRWGADLISRPSTQVCFPTGRVRFFDSEGGLRGAPLQGQMLIGWGVECRSIQAWVRGIRASAMPAWSKSALRRPLRAPNLFRAGPALGAYRSWDSQLLRRRG